MKKGIDISEWQTGLDYTRISKQIDFVILREGYRQTIDKMFLTHVAGFRALGAPIIAVYHFLYCTDAAGARAEAESCIRNVQRAGLPKTTRIFCDFEYDTVEKAEAKGIILGKAECMLFTRTFCETIEKAGYPTGIYTNGDYYVNYYEPSIFQKYPLWYAHYDASKPSKDCLIWQYSESGRLKYHSGKLDMDIWYDEKEQKLTEDLISDGISDRKEVDTMGVTAEQVLNVYRSWIGLSRGAGTHTQILDIYNQYIRTHSGAGRGYQVQRGDAFCDTTFSAAFIKLGAVDAIGGVECGVEEHVKIFKKAGIWEENGSITPKPGYGIIYNWDDATQPNDGYSDHIGIVEKVSGGQITCIEGNINGGMVARRTIPVGYGYIRGYVKPKYAEAAAPTTAPTTAPTINLIPGSSSIELKSFLIGAVHPQVRTIQRILNALGYKGKDGKALEVDGSLGYNTAYAIECFQKAKGMQGINYGTVAAKTWTYLLNE